MKINVIEHVSDQYAVLATCAEDLKEPCYDLKNSGNNYFWAEIENGADTTTDIALIEIDPDGHKRICKTSFVIEKRVCRECGARMNPYYDIRKRPAFWQECPSCGHILVMKWDAKDD